MSGIAAELPLEFDGPAVCGRGPAPLGVLLRGRPRPDDALASRGVSGSDEVCVVALTTVPTARLPGRLEHARVEQAAPGKVRIKAEGVDVTLPASAVHVHRDVGAAFYAAVVPRRASLGRRLFWRVVLALARTNWGLGLLGALRRR